MFDKLFKKPQPTPAILPTQPPALELGKEITFKDPKTGEFVYQRALNPEQRKIIAVAMQHNGECATQAIGMFRQKLALDKASSELNDRINKTEKEINDAVQKCRDELKIDKRWLLNPNLMILERRESPGA